ncbi:hypothetical protein SAMN06265348_104167 [Pedobacter westerhofensis]|uniref:Uncharacterized protein n=1 Tax=Pedobacter westerhofensis TaxID=425512 RepID=A0A521CUS1_9SPHI|nr:DUF4384 domain-containing protein [Pedobacter westerhofensis]SMO62471.1 hypothetical protein SAMN06265348_104167 [Pedobacter westerhofensis]
MQITTSADNGYLRVYLYDSDGVKLLSFADNDTANVVLQPNTTYQLEYHYWSSNPARYTIKANPPFIEYTEGITFDLAAAAESENIINVTTPLYL